MLFPSKDELPHVATHWEDHPQARCWGGWWQWTGVAVGCVVVRLGLWGVWSGQEQF